NTDRGGHRSHLGRSYRRTPRRRGHQLIRPRDPPRADHERPKDDDVCLSDGGFRHRVYAVTACAKTGLRRTNLPDEGMRNGRIDVAIWHDSTLGLFQPPDTTYGYER